MAFQDFYMRAENDPKYRKGIFSVSDEDEGLFQNIRMIIETPKYAVLGNPAFGGGESEYLFAKPSKLKGLKSKLLKQIIHFSLLAFKRDITVNTLVSTNNGTENIVFVDIKADGKTIYNNFL